jgi:hypothetical protein
MFWTWWIFLGFFFVIECDEFVWVFGFGVECDEYSDQINGFAKF